MGRQFSILQKLKYAKLQKLKRLEKQNEVAKYQKQPLLWLKERFGEDPESLFWSKYPNYENHIWDGSVDPLVNCWLDVANKNWVGVESATGTGKTFIASRIAMWFLDVFDNSLVVIIGPTSSQLRDNMWAEMARAFPKFQSIRPSAELLEMKLRVRGKGNLDEKGWQCISRSGMAGPASQEEKSTAKTQGFHRKDMLFVVDETPGVSQSILNAIENTCTGTNNIIIAFGNPDSEVDPLHKFCKKKSVKHYIISGYDHPNVVTGEEIVHGAVTVESIQRRIDDYGQESSFFKSRVRGQCPVMGKNSLFDLDAFEMCVMRDDIPFDDSLPALGQDVANSSSGDKAANCWGIRNYMVYLQSFQCEDASALADNVYFDDSTLDKHEIKNYNTKKLDDYAISPINILVDGVGLGVSTLNRYNRLKLKVSSTAKGVEKSMIPKDKEGKLLYAFNSFRTQMIFELAKDINQQKICLKYLREDHELKDKIKLVLSVIKQKLTSNKIAVTPKDEIKKYLGNKSPDEFDCLVYWNWARKLKGKDTSGYEFFGVEHV